MKTDSGITAVGLGHTGYNVFSSLLGLNIPWEELRDSDKADWENAGNQAIFIVQHILDASDNNGGGSIPARQLARKIADTFIDQETFNNLPESDKLVWEAVGRHMVNLIDSEKSQDAAEHEKRIAQWYHRKLQGVIA